MEQKNYSEINLLQFLRQSAVSGLINPSTSVSRKKAAEQLLTQLNTIERQDLRQLDVDELCSRFHKLQGSTIREESLEIYKNRLKAALEDFIAWVDNPIDFVPGHSNQPRAIQKNADRLPSTAAENAKEELALNLPDNPTGIFPIPIRQDRVVYLQNLPLDLSSKEAQKIVAVVQALVEPDA
jgi:chromosome condensin MukBEF ATPase and DNA-binding subunit MukB